MRASHALAVTVTAFAAVGLAATSAAAGGGPATEPVNAPANVTVNPSRVHQGATLQVSAEGCGQSGGKVWSNAFPTVNLSPGRVGYAKAHIRDNATPGQYSLSVKCNESDNNFGGGGNGGHGGNGGQGGNGADRGDHGGKDPVATARFTVLPSRGAQGASAVPWAPVPPRCRSAVVSSPRRRSAVPSSSSGAG